MVSLNVTEIYSSLQGESSFVGLPCVFVRLAGCPLNCAWCDTKYANTESTGISLEEVFERIKSFGIKLVEVTGGEPLFQSETLTLLESLVKSCFKVLLETSGALSLENIPKEVHIIMDIKCPDSGMDEKNLWDNLSYLKNTDEIKFVIASRLDFDWALEKIKRFDLEKRFNLLLGCVFEELSPSTLSQWILSEQLDCRLNPQLHKYIWGPNCRGV